MKHINIYICESNQTSLLKTQSNVEKAISKLKGDFDLVLAAQEADAFLSKCQPRELSVYFISLNMIEKLEGLKLAVKVRAVDSRGYIILIADDSINYSRIIKEKIEILDVIQRGDVNYYDAIEHCLEYIFIQKQSH